MDASTSVSLLKAEYDYVVVGGGTAGLVVASRLSEDDQVKVIVLEAGDNHLTDPGITPAGWSAVLGSEVDWSFKTSAQVMLPALSYQTQVADSPVVSRSNFVAESFAIPRVEYLEDQAPSTQKLSSLHPPPILKHGSASEIQAGAGT